MPILELRSSQPEVFLSFEGVTGEHVLPEATIPAGPGTDWTPLVACRLEAELNLHGRAIQASAGRRVDFGGDAPPLVIAKLTDAATVGLMREVLTGRDPRSAHVVFVRTDADGPTEYLRYELQGCTVISFEMMGVGAERTAEEFGIMYKQLTIISFADGHGAKGARSSAVLLNGA
jgi:type VI protein secretion system component Hcp